MKQNIDFFHISTLYNGVPYLVNRRVWFNSEVGLGVETSGVGVGLRIDIQTTCQSWRNCCKVVSFMYHLKTKHLKTESILCDSSYFRPNQNDSHFSDSIIKYIFLDWNICILSQLSVYLVGRRNLQYYKAAIYQLMAWCWMSQYWLIMSSYCQLDPHDHIQVIFGEHVCMRICRQMTTMLLPVPHHPCMFDFNGPVKEPRWYTLSTCELP